ncbi:MAG TPA: amidohydrolase family protein [Gemmatimonadales bacterium]|nr:amidohydrolase family protein [Gemmatimonadales bacterium]
MKRLGAIALTFASACSPGKGSTAYVGATLWDGAGGPAVPDAVVLVSSGRVTAVGSAEDVRIPRGAEEVHLDGKWIIPGLIDAHTHVTRWTLPRLLAYGVTSVRDVGGPNDSVFALRDEVSLGALASPRLFVAGAMIDRAPVTWPGAVGVRNSEEARRAVDDRTLRDASLVKVHARVDSALLAAVLDEAGTMHLPVAAHLGKVDAITAARMGVATIEHLTGVVEATVGDPGALVRAHDVFFDGWKAAGRAWATLDSARLDATARTLKDAGVAMVPTLVLHETIGRFDDESFVASLDLGGVPEAARAGWNVPGLLRMAGYGPGDLAAFRRSRPAQDLFVRLFKHAGGLIAAGTDTPGPLIPPGASLHDELGLLVKAGLTPDEALLAATRDAARVVGVDSVGVVRPGAVADFVVLSASPFADIANSRKIELVVVRGVARRPSELRGMWHR